MAKGMGGIIGVAGLLFFVFLCPIVRAAGQDVAVIFEDGGNPITTALDLRVSLWDAYDVKSGEVNPDGSINALARHYGWYQTTYTITPQENGSFTPYDSRPGYYNVELSTIAGFPVIGPINAYLQLEYKYPAEPDTAYRIFDFMDDAPWNNVTRFLIDPNATWYVLDAGPKTNWNTFTLDGNNNAPTDIKLEFGDTLKEYLQWSKANVRFELSDSLYVGGYLEVSSHIDFNLNEAKEMRLENLALAPTCDSNSKGRLYYNTGDNLPYFCNGTGWGQL
jgi:hypothetical protein